MNAKKSAVKSHDVIPPLITQGINMHPLNTHYITL